MTELLSRRILSAAGSLVGVGALAGCTGASGPGDRATPDPVPSVDGGSPSSPLAGETFYLDPAGHVPTALATARELGEADDVEVLSDLARPTARWFAGQDLDPTAAARTLTQGAEAAGETPVVVLYNIPSRDCEADFSGGGLADADAYKAWVGQVAEGLEDRPALAILEPDAVPQAIVGC